MSSLHYTKVRIWDGGSISCPETIQSYEDKRYTESGIGNTPNSAPGTLLVLSVAALYKVKQVK